MTRNRKPVRLRRVAAEDVDAALSYYVEDAGAAVAARFVDSIEQCLAHVGLHPHDGSLRFAYDLDMPELRCLGLRTFPYLVFYVERADAIDVWRVLHHRRDIPATLRDIDDE